MASSESTAPRGLPGRLMSRVFSCTPATARESTARGVFLRPTSRMSSAKPGSSLVQTAEVASGVTSRGPMPVPPVVRIKSSSPASARVTRRERSVASSSGVTWRDNTCQPYSEQRAATTTPDISWRSFWATESLTVMMAARITGRSGLSGRGIARGFVHQAQRFHQETLRGALDADLFGVGVEVDLEFALVPLNHAADGLFAYLGAVRGVFADAAGEIHLALLGALPHGEPAGFLPHLERLQQVDDVHLLEAPFEHPGARGALLEFFERQPVDHFLGASHQLFHEERFLDVIFDAVYQRPEFLFDFRAAGNENKWRGLGGLASAKLFVELPPIHSRHLVIGDDHVRGLVHGFQESIHTVRGDVDFGVGLEAARDQLAHVQVVVHHEHADALHRCAPRCVRPLASRLARPLVPAGLSISERK